MAFLVLVVTLLWTVGAIAGMPEGLEKYDPKNIPQLSLITVGQGHSAFDSFGQTALRVKVDAKKVDDFYTFCVLDRKKSGLVELLTGHLTYRLVRYPYARAVAHYRGLGRELVEQKLSPTIEGAYELAAALDSPDHPDKAGYELDFFTNNCTTKVRDLIDQSVSGRLHETWTQKDPQTMREHVLRMSADALLSYVALDFLLGPGADTHESKWEVAFLPQTLQRAADTVRFHGVHGAASLVRESQQVLEGPRVQIRRKAPERTQQILRGNVIAVVSVLVLGSLAFGGGILSRAVFAVALSLWGLATGLLGTAALVLTCFSSQKLFAWNVNVFACGPWALALPALGWQIFLMRPKALRIAFIVTAVSALGALAALGLARLPQVAQDNTRVIALCLPLWVAFCYSLFTLRYPHFSLSKKWKALRS